MSEEKWKVIKCKFETTLENWEIDKKCNQFTVDSICSLFPTEAQAIIDYIEQLQQENQQLKSVLDEIREYIKEKEKDGTLWTVKATDGLLQILDKGE